MITIFNDELNNYIDNNIDMIRGYLQDNNQPENNNNIFDAGAVLLADDYQSIKELLKSYDKNINYDYILCSGSLGLWYGRRKASARFNSLYDAILSTCYDNNILYVNNKNAALSLKAYHHDGCNKFKYYKVIRGKKYAIKYDELIKLF